MHVRKTCFIDHLRQTGMPANNICKLEITEANIYAEYHAQTALCTFVAFIKCGVYVNFVVSGLFLLTGCINNFI